MCFPLRYTDKNLCLGLFCITANKSEHRDIWSMYTREADLYLSAHVSAVICNCPLAGTRSPTRVSKNAVYHLCYYRCGSRAPTFTFPPHSYYIPFSKFMIVVVEALNLFLFWHYNVAPGARTQPSGPPAWPSFACSWGKPRWITYVHYLKGEAHVDF